jgi:CheY-like chemotaxis protein
VESNPNKLILIVDDSLDNQELLKIVLLSQHYNVHCASNGEEALAMLSELNTLPDLILLDAQMPIMDGYEFRIQQNKIERIKDIPVLIMTGDSDINVSRNMNHPFGVLVKPLGISKVIESISNCF